LFPLPEDFKESNDDEWYPPGHGDFFDSFYKSDLFEKYKKLGKEYIFVSNIDNLGATVDINILNYLLENDIDFCMEVTKKTTADVKGGTLIDYEDKLKLLELPSVPKEYIEEFKSIKKFKIFNTNNLWIKMASIEENVNKFIDLDIIVNNKLYNGRQIIQLETACGSAIELFKNSIGINVDRTRFLPVKKTSDLLLVQSNLYTLQHGQLVFNQKRIEKMDEESLPNINLGEFFTNVSDYQKRFPTIPDLLELNHLTVSGNVYFGKNIVLKGNVIIVAHDDCRIDIPDNSVLENKVITGDLRIHDN